MISYLDKLLNLAWQGLANVDVKFGRMLVPTHYRHSACLAVVS